MHTKKHFRNLHKLLLPLGLSLCLLLCMGTGARAEEQFGNAAEGGGGSSTMTIVGGPNYRHTGWFIYVVDADQGGKQITNTFTLWSSNERPTGRAYGKYPETAFGGPANYESHFTADQFLPQSLCTPFTVDGKGNGAKIKTYILSNRDNLRQIFAKGFNDSNGDFYQKFISTDDSFHYYLVVEPFFWGQMYNGNKASGTWLLASAKGWADTQYKLQYANTESGSPLISRYTNNTYPNCVKLESSVDALGRLSPDHTGKVTNHELLLPTSGWGYMLFSAKNGNIPDPVLSEFEKPAINKQLYAIQNWSEEFDISKAIPSGEKVNNRYEADSFYGNIKTTSPTKTATYSYQYKYKYQTYDKVGTERKKHTNPDGSIYYTSHSKYDWRDHYAYKTAVFSAQVKYEVLTQAQIYAIDKLTVYNEALEGPCTYTAANSSFWTTVAPDVKVYTKDASYNNQMGLSEIDEAHCYPPPNDIIAQGEVNLGHDGNRNIDSQFEKDLANAKKKVNDNSWSRNDKVIVNVQTPSGNTAYVFMQDTKVTGCIISGSYNNSSATANGRYGGNGILIDSVQPIRAKGSMTKLIPPTTDNLNYPTGVQAEYKSLVNTVNQLNSVFRAGRGIFRTDATAEDIYKHVIEGTIPSTSDWNMNDKPGGDGYDIKVHTPTIAPFMITDNYAAPQETPDHQLIDVDDDATYQLKLDERYMLRWNLDQWVSYKYGNAKGYDENAGFPSKYDKYITKKEVKFPFDVWYDGTFYRAGKWIETQAPSNINTLWSSNLSVEERNEYESRNHWQMMPFYIPSYAKEGSGKIETRVYAHNVEGRYEGSHDVESAMEVKKNTQTGGYIGTYAQTDQLSGHIYGFTITGVDDKEMYNEVVPGGALSDIIEYGLCPVKEEKLPGIYNRR